MAPRRGGDSSQPTDTVMLWPGSRPAWFHCTPMPLSTALAVTVSGRSVKSSSDQLAVAVAAGPS